MVEVVTAGKNILSFDGRVLEEFGTGAKRVHVRHMKDVNIKEKRKGRCILQVGAVFTPMSIIFEENERALIDQLVSELNAALVSHQADAVRV